MSTCLKVTYYVSLMSHWVNVCLFFQNYTVPNFMWVVAYVHTWVFSIWCNHTTVREFLIARLLVCICACVDHALKVWQRIWISEKITTSKCELTFKTRSKRNAIKVLTRFERQRVYAWVTCVGTCWRPRVLRILCGCVRVWTDDNILTPLPRVERDVVFGEAEK